MVDLLPESGDDYRGSACTSWVFHKTRIAVTVGLTDSNK